MSLAGSPAISANIVWGKHLMPAIYSWPHCRGVIHSPLLGSNRRLGTVSKTTFPSHHEDASTPPFPPVIAPALQTMYTLLWS